MGCDQLSYPFVEQLSAQLSRSLPLGATFIKNIVYTIFVIMLGSSVF